MKTTSKLLADFISDFHLQDIDHTICFNANIEFSATGIFKKLDTPVHIVCSSGLGESTIQLLHPDIRKQHLPESITYKEENAVYLPKKFLVLKGEHSFYGPFVIRLFPITHRCINDTLMELQHKRWN